MTMNNKKQDGLLRYVLPLLLFIFMLGLLSANLGNSFHISQDLLKAAESVDHSRQVRDSLFQLKTDYFDAESGQRGYLLTGDRDYLKFYTTARMRVNADIDVAGKLAANDPVQQIRLVAVKRVTSEKFAELALTITLHDTKGEAAALQLVRTNAGRDASQQFREQLDAMVVDAMQTVKFYQDAEVAEVKKAQTVNITNCLMIFLVTIVLVLSYYTRTDIEPTAENKENSSKPQVASTIDCDEEKHSN